MFKMDLLLLITIYYYTLIYEIVILNALKNKWPTEISYRDAPLVTDVITQYNIYSYNIYYNHL